MVFGPLTQTSMTGTHSKFINEEFLEAQVTPTRLDVLFAAGWRHSGYQFYRYNCAIYKNEIRAVIPLRIRLKNFVLSKSQRRILRKNSDVKTLIRPTIITSEAESMFRRHAARFKENPPASLFEYFFVSDPAVVPCETRELCVFEGSELIAISYIDLGQDSISGIYGMFEPTHSRRSLGIYTILKEIEFATESGKEFYYLGYSYEGPSFYDYKKQFIGTEAYDWNGRWEPFIREQNV